MLLLVRSWWLAGGYNTSQARLMSTSHTVVIQPQPLEVTTNLSKLKPAAWFAWSKWKYQFACKFWNDLFAFYLLLMIWIISNLYKPLMLTAAQRPAHQTVAVLGSFQVWMWNCVNVISAFLKTRALLSVKRPWIINKDKNKNKKTFSFPLLFWTWAQLLCWPKSVRLWCNWTRV